MTQREYAHTLLGAGTGNTMISRRGWQLTSAVTSSHFLTDVHAHTPLSSCIRCIRLLDGALLWPRWACKVQFWLPCPGLLGQGCDLESMLKRKCMHIVLDRVLGPIGSLDWHLSNKAITDLTDVFVHFTQLLRSQTFTHTMWITTTFSATSLSQKLINVTKMLHKPLVIILDNISELLWSD